MSMRVIFFILVEREWTTVTLYTSRRIKMVEERVSELQVTSIEITQCGE